MSDVAPVEHRIRGLVRPALRPWRVAVLVVVVALAVGSILHLRSDSGSGKGTGLTASGPSGQNAANNGSQTGSNGSSGNGSNPGSGANGSSSGQGGNGANGHATASPKPVPSATPHDSVFGYADILHSDCAGGYEPGSTCTIYYSGVYELISQPAGKLVFEAIIDGTPTGIVTDTPAPAGGHRFGGDIKFTVPQHAKKIVYQSFLEDATGKVIVSSATQTTYGYG